MKKFLLFVLAAHSLILFSCGGNSSGYKGKLDKKFLTGTWMISGTDFSLDQGASDYFSMHLMHFKKDGTILYDTAGPIVLNGKYEAETKAMKIVVPGMPAIYFSLENGSDSSLALIIEKHSGYSGENGKILLKRMDNEQYKLDNIAWKQPAAAPLTDKAIGEKLYDMLVYYENLLGAMDSRDVTLFSLRKIPLPFYYTADGLGMKKFQHRDRSWDIYFTDSTQSYKAYTLLERSFYNTGKSDEVRHFRRYAPMFGIIARNVRKAIS